MSRFGVKRFGFATLAIASALALHGCGARIDGEPRVNDTQSSAPQEGVGSLGLHLQPVAGVTLTSLHYVITRGNAPGSPVVAEGNLPSPGTSSAVTFGVSVPAGTGYYLSVTAVAAESDAITCASSVGPFDVTSNSGSAISVVLLCVDNSEGQALPNVDVHTDACPQLVFDHIVAMPTMVDIGESIQTMAGAHDSEHPGRAITYAWSLAKPAQAFIGQFNPANAANSVFTCASAADPVRLRVTASNGQCSKSLETSVSCIGDLHGCGNGVVDPNEDCDTALDPTCPSDCTRVCGDGVVESGEQCDPVPANPAICFPPGTPSQCQIRLDDSFCHDGFVGFSEACDGDLGPGNVPLPAGSYCANECSVIKIAHCGDGVLEPGEECEPALTPGCSSSCQPLFSSECLACEQAGDCFASTDNCNGPSGSFTSAQRALCGDVMQCIIESNCLDGSGSLGRCYCGTLSTAACGAAPYNLSSPGAPNGPCAAIMQQGNPGVTTNSGILGGLTTKSRPSGAAGQRLNCQKVDPACAPVCGLQ